jgi:hypothetical protein
VTPQVRVSRSTPLPYISTSDASASLSPAPGSNLSRLLVFTEALISAEGKRRVTKKKEKRERGREKVRDGLDI